MGLFGFGKKKKDEYETIYYDDNINAFDCPMCGTPDGMTRRDGNVFYCDICHYIIGEEEASMYLAGNLQIEQEVFLDYDDVYGSWGEEVACGSCIGGHIKWKDGQYICPNCGNVMPRSEFFNAIGAEPPGPECITCSEPYPACSICPYGYEPVADYI